jgi:hypothetical protein
MVGLRVLCVAAALSMSQAYALDIKGVTVGEKANCEQIRALEVRPGNFFKSCESLQPLFIHRISFLNGQAMMGVRQSPEGIVSAVSVSEFSFDDALEALTQKFGSPRVTNSVVQNAMGAQFDQVSAVWEDDVAILRLKRHGSKLGEPSLILVSKETINNMSQERSKASGNI